MSALLLVSEAHWTALAAVAGGVTAAIIGITGGLVFLQLRDLRKTSTIQAWVTVFERLQDEKVRTARGVLIGIKNTDFTTWGSDEIRAAELACSRYEELGHFLRVGILDDSKVIADWRDSIIKCYEAALPMLKSYRHARGSDFWYQFDWLYMQAKTQAKS